MHAVFVVADDFTGANDTAGRLAQAGFSAHVRLGADPPAGSWPEALLLNAGTRLAGAHAALEGSRRAWRPLVARHGARVLFQKIDSTLRGQPLAGLEGLFAESGCLEAAVVPAYPALGRVVRGGELWVHGHRLDRSEYAHDPVTPAATHRVDRLFSGLLPHAHVPLAAVRRGVGGLRRAIAGLRGGLPRPRVLTFDCVAEADLDTIAQACLAEGVRAYCGASGLAAALARALRPQGRPARPAGVPPALLALAGTVSETTRGQVEACRAAGWTVGSLTPADCLGMSAGRRAALLAPARAALAAGGACVLRSSQCRGDVDATRRLARARGLDPAGAADAAMRALAGLGRDLAGVPHTVLLTGGHAAETYLALRGIRGNDVYAELVPGLPLALAEGGGQWMLTKPGGFGTPDALVRLKDRLGEVR